MGFYSGKTAIVWGALALRRSGRLRRIDRLRHRHSVRQGRCEPCHHRPQREKLDAAKELEGAYGIEVLTAQADINASADNKAVAQGVVDEAMAKFGRIDFLVNNAQASASGVTLADHTPEQFDLAIYSGLYAAFYYMQACYPHLKETRFRRELCDGAGLFRQPGSAPTRQPPRGIRRLTRVAATGGARTAST